MTLLPSPIPHPLDYSPFDVPDWAYEALEWVVGFDWPAGNEAATWDVADRWYALATSLAEPRDEAFAAASQILSGYGGEGITADGFRDAWQQLAGDENAPLNALLQIAQELGELVEECGRDLEAAKLEAWIEIGVFLIELVGMSVAVVLTLGAASPAAGGLIMATRLAIQQIFKRLIAQLGKKALKQTAQRTIKDLTTKQGLNRLGRGGLREGLDEMGEEAATNASIQTYQQSTGRAHGVDLTDLSMSAAGGFAGGFASRGADVGSHGHAGPLRGAGGEVMAEFGAAAVYGELPDVQGVAKSAASGATGSAMHGLPSSFDVAFAGGVEPFARTPEVSTGAGSEPGRPFADATSPPLGPTADAQAGPGAPVAQAEPATPTATEAQAGSTTVIDAQAGSTTPTAAEARVDSPSPPLSAGSDGAADAALAPRPDATAFAPPTASDSAGVEASSVQSPVAATAVPGPAPADAAAFPTQSSDGPSAPSLAATSPPSPDSLYPGQPTVSSGPTASFGPPVPLASAPQFAAQPLDQSAPLPGPATASAGPTTTLAAPTALSTTPPAPAVLSVVSVAPTAVPARLTSQSKTSAAPARPSPTATTPAGPFTTATTPSSPTTTATTPSSPATTATAPSSPATTATTLAGSATASAAPAGPDDPGATRRRPLSDLDRIADALAPRPVRRSALPELSALSPANSGTISPPSAPPPPDPTRWRVPPLAARPKPPAVSAPLPPNLDRATPPRPRTGDGPPRDEAGYFGYADHARRTHELNRREDYINYLAGIAESNRTKILDLGRQADAAFRVGATLRGAAHRRQAAELSAVVAEIETQIDQIRTGHLAPATVEVDPHDWARINADVGNLAPGGIRTDDRSALTGSDDRPPIDRSRRYNTYGGLRPPLAVHQLDLENAVPRGTDGRATRLPDPRVGTWFHLANDGGPEADPTRGLNCVDGVLALYDTYLHGRPRVSAPRTFDTYAHGNPNRPLGGEWEGVRRIQQVTGGSFQNLCPYVGGTDPTLAKPAMDIAIQNLTNHLHNSGHGAFAFIITDLEGGGCHSWAAINHNNTILFLDPQIGRLTEGVPLYRHHGVPTRSNIISMDALVVTAEGVHTPLPYHGPGLWTAPPTGAEETPTQRDERLALESLTTEQRRFLERSVAESRKVATDVSRDLHRVLSELPARDTDERPMIVDEEKRVKTLGSLARKFKGRFETRTMPPEEILGRIKDRVRFSVRVPERRYGESVRAVLRKLQMLGYHTVVMESFWSDNGRHNGLNVNVTNRDGFTLEIQFPTPLSVDVGHQTHSSYEDVRRDDLPVEARVSAFLDILQINKEREIYLYRPQDLELLREFLGDQPAVDTTLAGWLKAKPGRLRAYLGYLATSGSSFEEILREHGLGIEDVPGTTELGLIGDAPGLRLRTGDDGRPDDGHEHHRLPGES